MQTVLFSALFGVADRTERIAFLEKLQTHMPSDVRLVAFNASAEIDATIPVFNTGTQLKPEISDAKGAFERLVRETCPNHLEALIAHTNGEAGHTPASYEANLIRHTRFTKSFITALDEYTPSYVFLWNQFNALHRHFAAILDKRGIQYGFFHDGLLPGSVAFDFDGEMGESWIAKDPDKFQAIEVSLEDRARAQEFLDTLQSRNIDRHIQRDNISVADALEAIRRHDRPIVFYAGQVDWHAGICPDGPQRLPHSPFYTSTLDALAHLDKVAGKLGVFILFKPHPISKDKYVYLDASDYPNTLILNSATLNACINAADIVTTIASQTSYVALMAGKSVMMMGRNQITGKDLTYDLTSRGSLKDLILTALKDPLAQSRKNGLADHVARLEKAYLFDFNTLDIPFYRRDAQAAAQAILSKLQSIANPILSPNTSSAPKTKGPTK